MCPVLIALSPRQWGSFLLDTNLCHPWPNVAAKGCREKEPCWIIERRRHVGLLKETCLVTFARKTYALSALE
jgi:hypothetical protein